MLGRVIVDFEFLDRSFEFLVSGGIRVVGGGGVFSGKFLVLVILTREVFLIVWFGGF